MVESSVHDSPYPADPARDFAAHSLQTLPTATTDGSEYTNFQAAPTFVTDTPAIGGYPVIPYSDTSQNINYNSTTSSDCHPHPHQLATEHEQVSPGHHAAESSAGWPQGSNTQANEEDESAAPFSYVNGEWVCNECQKSYSKKYDFNKHYRNHEREIMCELGCDLGFAQNKDRDRHYIAHHPMSEEGREAASRLMGPCPYCKRTQRLDNLPRHLRTCSEAPRD